MKTLSFTSKFKTQLKGTNLITASRKPLDSILAYKLQKRHTKKKSYTRSERIVNKFVNLKRKVSDRSTHKISKSYDDNKVSGRLVQVALYSDCSTLTGSVSSSTHDYIRNNISVNRYHETTDNRICKVFVISCGVSSEESTDGNEEWMIIIVGNYAQYKNVFLQTETYLNEGEERMFPVRFCFMYYAMINIELQVASQTLIKQNLLQGPLVLPTIFGHDTTSADNLQGLMIGLATSKKQVDSLIAALTALHNRYLDSSFYANSASSLTVVANIIVAEYVSKGNSEMIALRLVLKMIRTRFNVAVI